MPRSSWHRNLTVDMQNAPLNFPKSVATSSPRHAIVSSDPNIANEVETGTADPPEQKRTINTERQIIQEEIFSNRIPRQEPDGARVEFNHDEVELDSRLSQSYSHTLSPDNRDLFMGRNATSRTPITANPAEHLPPISLGAHLPEELKLPSLMNWSGPTLLPPLSALSTRHNTVPETDKYTIRPRCLDSSFEYPASRRLHEQVPLTPQPVSSDTFLGARTGGQPLLGLQSQARPALLNQYAKERVIHPVGFVESFTRHDSQPLTGLVKEPSSRKLEGNPSILHCLAQEKSLLAQTSTGSHELGVRVQEQIQGQLPQLQTSRCHLQVEVRGAAPSRIHVDGSNCTSHASPPFAHQYSVTPSGHAIPRLMTNEKTMASTHSHGFNSNEIPPLTLADDHHSSTAFKYCLASHGSKCYWEPACSSSSAQIHQSSTHAIESSTSVASPSDRAKTTTPLQSADPSSDACRDQSVHCAMPAKSTLCGQKQLPNRKHDRQTEEPAKSCEGLNTHVPPLTTSIFIDEPKAFHGTYAGDNSSSTRDMRMSSVLLPSKRRNADDTIRVLSDPIVGGRGVISEGSELASAHYYMSNSLPSPTVDYESYITPIRRAGTPPNRDNDKDDDNRGGQWSNPERYQRTLNISKGINLQKPRGRLRSGMIEMRLQSSYQSRPQIEAADQLSQDHTVRRAGQVDNYFSGKSKSLHVHNSREDPAHYPGSSVGSTQSYAVTSTYQARAKDAHLEEHWRNMNVRGLEVPLHLTRNSTTMYGTDSNQVEFGVNHSLWQAQWTASKSELPQPTNLNRQGHMPSQNWIAYSQSQAQQIQTSSEQRAKAAAVSTVGATSTAIGEPRARRGTHVCNICGYAANQSSDLKRHQATHQDLRPFPCDRCGYAFRQKAHLNAHKRAIHNRLRPYQCDLCNREFAARSSLKRHVTYVHGRNPPFACPDCGATFIHVWDLNCHRTQSHPDGPSRTDAIVMNSPLMACASKYSETAVDQQRIAAQLESQPNEIISSQGMAVPPFPQSASKYNSRIFVPTYTNEPEPSQKLRSQFATQDPGNLNETCAPSASVNVPVHRPRTREYVASTMCFFPSYAACTSLKQQSESKSKSDLEYGQRITAFPQTTEREQNDDTLVSANPVSSNILQHVRPSEQRSQFIYEIESRSLQGLPALGSRQGNCAQNTAQSTETEGVPSGYTFQRGQEAPSQDYLGQYPQPVQTPSVPQLTERQRREPNNDNRRPQLSPLRPLFRRERR